MTQTREVLIQSVPIRASRSNSLMGSKAFDYGKNDMGKLGKDFAFCQLICEKCLLLSVTL